MTNLNFTDQEEGRKILKYKQGRMPRIIHLIVSVIYFPFIVLIIPYILSSVTAGYFDISAYVSETLIIGAIIISKILIDKGKTLLGFLILFFVPGFALIYFLPGHM